MFSKALYEAGRILIGSYTRLMLKMDVHWHTAMPKGPVLFAANHPSTTDPIFIHLISPRPMSVMITSKVFAIPVLGAYMRKMQQICVTPGSSERVLGEAEQTLAAGRSVTIFPEGAISPPDGGFHAPRSGVARLALNTGVPVIPIGIYLSEKGCRRIPARLGDEEGLITWYLRGPYGITIGKPMQFQGDADDHATVKQVAECIMENIRSLAWESRQRVMA